MKSSKFKYNKSKLYHLKCFFSNTFSDVYSMRGKKQKLIHIIEMPNKQPNYFLTLLRE